MIAAVQVYRQLADQQAQQQQQAMQREQMQMQKEDRESLRSAREQQQMIADLEIRSKLLEMGTPLVGGMLEKQGQVVPGDTPGVSAPMEFTYGVKPDPSKVLRYKDLAVIPYSRKEREKMALQQFEQQKQLEAQIAAEAAAMKRQSGLVGGAPAGFEQFGIRPGTPLTASEIGSVGSLLERENSLAQQERDRKQREAAAAASLQSRERLAQQANATRLQAAGISAAGADRRANTAADRVAQKRAESLQTKHDTLQQQEQAAWAEYRSASAAMSEAQKEIADNKLKTDDKGYGQAKAREAKARQAAEKAKALAESLLSQKLQVLKRKDALLGQDEAGKVQQKAAPAGAAPKKDPLGIL